MSNSVFGGFKPIEEFTFDECFANIEQNRVDNVESDEPLLERYTILLSQLQQKDDTMFRKATDRSSLENYLAAYPLDNSAKKYQLRHIAEAKKRIAKIDDDFNKRKKKITIAIFIIIGVVALFVCWINYSPVKYINVDESISFTKYGDSISITAQTNVPAYLIKMDVESGNDWLHVSGEDGNYGLVAKPNPIGSRYAKIKISAPNRLFGNNIGWDSKIINISQESGEPTYINLDRNSISFDKFGNSSDKSNLIISTDGVLEAVASAPDWCDFSFAPIENGKYECIITMDKNNGDRRYGQITLKGGNITQNILVQQESGLASYIGFNDSSLSVLPREETKYVDVRTDGTSWYVISKPSWVEASDNGNNSLKLVIAENDGERRDGTLTIKSNNGHTSSLAINQGTSKASYISAGQSSISAGTSGLDKYISVDTDGKDWSVYSKPSWLSVTPNYEGMTIYVEIPYNSGKMKEGEIVLASNNGYSTTITVKQDGDPTNFKAAKSSVKFDSSSDYEYVNIHNNSNQSLRVDESQSWITATATSKERIKISVSSNNTPARSGYVTVRCGNESCRIDVRQSGWTTCYYCNGNGKVNCPGGAWDPSIGQIVHSKPRYVITGYNYGPVGYWTTDYCPTCGGNGTLECSHCHGKGKITSN